MPRIEFNAADAETGRPSDIDAISAVAGKPAQELFDDIMTATRPLCPSEFCGRAALVASDGGKDILKLRCSQKECLDRSFVRETEIFGSLAEACQQLINVADSAASGPAKTAQERQDKIRKEADRRIAIIDDAAKSEMKDLRIAQRAKDKAFRNASFGAFMRNFLREITS